MFKQLFGLLLFTITFHIEASTDAGYEARVAWVKELKSFVHDLESRNPELLTTESGKKLKLRFSLFEEAIASGNYDCFFAGWPSQLIKNGKRQICQNPSKGNSEYQKGSCSNSQMQCQPLMFGKGLCVGFSTAKEKQMAFANCENKFKKNTNYDFLKILSNEEKTSLKEISLLAHDICETGKVGVQKSRPMCKNLLSKFKHGLESIERAPASENEKQMQDEKIKQVKSKVDEAKTAKEEEICDVPIVVDEKVENEVDALIKTVNTNTDKLYDDIKKEFLNSSFCAPEKVLNDPKDKLSPVLFTQLINEMRFVVDTNESLTREIKIMRFKGLAETYKLSPDTIKYGEEILKNYKDNSEGRFEAMARLRGVMLQNMAELASKTEGYEAESIKEGLGIRGIFKADEDGNYECPFVDENAFRDALAGREQVLAGANKSKITDPNIITIVDYSRPSNERRMFVIDLKNKKVLHNTWVGHGAGADRSMEAGPNKDGSSPATSNENGSLLSSEGFYIVKSASTGVKYLNNVTLEGIDVNNKNMGPRAVVVHGWRTPTHEYVNKTWAMSEGKGAKRLPGKDIYKEFMQIDFKTTQEDLFNLTMEVSNAAAARPYVDGTDGCLGVPETPMGHVDRKGRDKSQLELLRDDLPGTLMFNYTGPKKTKSQYLNN
jgi:L,D-transpeptidase catalytic domain